MSEASDPRSSPAARVQAFVRARPVVVAVVALTLLGLAARFVTLGVRPAHWDEARVAYWADYTFETGAFAYNAHTHGPLVQHLSRYLFGFFGANDFVARLPVAVIGGLLPLSALLYRDHLRDAEVVVLSGFLTANTVLVYYSRFMRSDLLVATFMFTTFGLLVRFYDTRRVRYLYGATACLVLGIASKENAPLYVLTWLGAGAIVLDAALYRPRSYRGGAALVVTKLGTLWNGIRRIRPNLAQYVGHVLGIAVVFVALFTFLFAPRGGGLAGVYKPPDGLSLWAALGTPLRIPDLVIDTFSYVAYPEWEYLGFGDMDAVLVDLPGSPDVEATAANSDPSVVPYLSRLMDMTDGLLTKAKAVVAFGIVGVFYERYIAERSRTLVLFMFFAALFSLLGYPLTLSIDAGWKWNMTHVVVPLSIPAAVGLGIVVRTGITAYRRRDHAMLGVSGLVVGAVALMVIITAATSAYAPQDRTEENPLVQYGQPADDLRPALEQIRTVAAESGGTDVIVYDGSTTGGAFLREDPDSVAKQFQPICTQWTNMLPLNWYLAAYDADTECVGESETLVDRIGDAPPPVVITRDSDASVPVSALEEEYQALTYRLRTHGSEATIYVHQDVWNDGR